MDPLLRIVGIVTPVLIIIAIGYAYGRLRKPDMTTINRLSMELLFPLLVCSSMASKEFRVVEHLPLLFAGTAMVLGSGALSWGVARALGYNPHAFVPPMMFANTANMGLPLTLFAYGAEMLPAAVSLFVISSLLHFTLGIRICAPQAEIRHILKAPMLWAMVLGLALSLLGISLPNWLSTSTRMLGEAAIPLALLALGVGFTQFRLGNWSVGVVGAIVCPLSSMAIAWGFAHALDLSRETQGLLMLYAALPPAVMNYLFAEKYGQDPGLVSAIVVVGNIASLLFVPLALYLYL